jgi:iron complex transport system ATP-binding protein
MTAAFRARKVAYVPQDENHAFGFTLRQIVAMGRLPLSGGLFDTAEDLAIADAALDRVGIRSLADRPITKVSGGEKQLALVARALAQGGRILLMDEPTAHLDLRHQADFIHLLRSLAQDGYGVVLAVHDPNLASVVAQQIILLNQGRVVAQGMAKEVLASDALHEVYSLEFQRVDASDGSLRLLPKY